MSRQKKRNLTVYLKDETLDIIDSHFPRGSFSAWLDDQLKIYAIQRIAITQNPEVAANLKDMQERAIQIIRRNRGGERMVLLAARWEDLIKTAGGQITAKELIELALEE